MNEEIKPAATNEEPATIGEAREKAQRLFMDSFEQQDEESGEAESEDRRRYVETYYAGWRDVLCELFPGLDLDLPVERGLQVGG